MPGQRAQFRILPSSLDVGGEDGLTSQLGEPGQLMLAREQK